MEDIENIEWEVYDGKKYCYSFKKEDGGKYAAIAYARQQQMMYGGDHCVYKVVHKFKKVWG